MKRALLLMSIFSIVVFAIVGCRKDPLDFGNVGVLTLGLKCDCQFANKAAIESFDARVTIYYSTEDTIGYNCRFLDADGDGLFSNDLAHSESIYVRREVGFWVGVSAVIQGDTLSGMSDPTSLLYLSGENSVLDIEIVLTSGYPRIIVNSNTEINGEGILLYGEVIEGAESLEMYAFALKRGQLSDDEKRFWAKRILTESDMQQLDENDDYLLYDAEPLDTNPNIFVTQLYAQELDSAEYSVVALATLRMDDGDSVPTVIHSPVITMSFPGNGALVGDYVYLDEPSWNGDTVTLSAYYAGNSELYECGFVYGGSDSQLTDTLMCRETSQLFSYDLYNLELTTYYYKAYVKTPDGMFESEIGQFTKPNAYSEPTGYKDGYGYVDLGLPSGLLWAYTNVGANSPIEYGNYYAWGETETKETYDWETYQYCDDSETTLTKYCSDASYGLDGFTDALTTLESDDDAASFNWGGNWRMPTQDEMQELIDNCDTAWIEINGINGMLFTSRTNGNSIFLPAAGNYDTNSLNNLTTMGNYWSSSLRTDSPNYAWYLYFNSGTCSVSDFYRFYGYSVRPVCVQSKKKRK